MCLGEPVRKQSMYPEKVIESNEGVAPGSGKHSPEQMMPLLSHGLPCVLYRCAYMLLGNKADAEISLWTRGPIPRTSATTPG